MTTIRWTTTALAAMAAALALPAPAHAAGPMLPDGRIGYTDSPLLPWTAGWRKHDPDRPQPPKVTPGINGAAPSDAVVLFDGRDTSAWASNGWTLAEGALVCGKGDLETRAAFGSCQLHLEWMTPDPPGDQPMNRGNSGVFFMGRYEFQIFDSFSQPLYADGIAASVYGETPPLAAAALPPGRWQTFDLVFLAPEFDGGRVARPARLTAFHNGVLVQYDTEIRGPCAHKSIAPYRPHEARLPLKLQSHGSPVRFRNIWIRPFDRGDLEAQDGRGRGAKPGTAPATAAPSGTPKH